MPVHACLIRVYLDRGSLDLACREDRHTFKSLWLYVCQIEVDFNKLLITFFDFSLMLQLLE